MTLGIPLAASAPDPFYAYRTVIAYCLLKCLWFPDIRKQVELTEYLHLREFELPQRFLGTPRRTTPGHGILSQANGGEREGGSEGAQPSGVREVRAALPPKRALQGP